jgi:hypothetical protein
MHLRNIRAIKKCIPRSTKILLVTNLIIANIDYCNALFICSPKYVTDLLQKVLNKAVRFIFDLKRTDHISPFLCQLHILPVLFRIKFKVCLIAFKIINGMAPGYLADKVNLFRQTSTAYHRLGCGRDWLMFEFDLYQQKNCTWISEMILEWNSSVFLKVCTCAHWCAPQNVWCAQKIWCAQRCAQKNCCAHLSRNRNK